MICFICDDASKLKYCIILGGFLIFTESMFEMFDWKTIVAVAAVNLYVRSGHHLFSEKRLFYMFIQKGKASEFRI